MAAVVSYYTGRSVFSSWATSSSNKEMNYVSFASTRNSNLGCRSRNTAVEVDPTAPEYASSSLQGKNSAHLGETGKQPRSHSPAGSLKSSVSVRQFRKARLQQKNVQRPFPS
jgi:hypothetical protein